MQICPQCGGQHPGLEHGDVLPPDVRIRRAIPAGKEGPPNISPSAFDDVEMSCDLVARKPSETLATIGATMYVEFEVQEATRIFAKYSNQVIFRCIPGNPYHCQVEGKKTRAECKKFTTMMTPRLKS
jgi:hypothetical protein